MHDYSWFEPVKSCCDHEADDCTTIQSDCCSFEDYSFKLSDSHQASFLNLVFPSSIKEYTHHWELSQQTSDQIKPTVPSFKGPPLTVPLFIRHQSLVLYA